ncbi:thioesterase family protein [Actinomadura chokoriensis]|uniref:Thioesterase family protein n=1 Tax=Actinomadura chokoriensis TaxID=454156 RepID=A0ABV4R7U1_9ACTN
MSASGSGFGEATAVERVDDGRYEAVLDPGYGILGAINGGYLMVVLARAAVDASPHAHPISTATNFHRVAKPGPAQVIVDSRKTGRTAASALVTLVQDDRPVVDALITTGTLDTAAEPIYAGPPPTPVPPLEECTDLRPPTGGSGFADRVDMRFDRRTMGWLDGTPSGSPEMRAWFRHRDGYEIDAFSLALAVDALPPVALNLGAQGWAPTVELTWHLRAVPVPGWLAVHGTGRLLADGWFDEEVEVRDTTGRLVAQSRQIARVPRTGS